MNNEEIIIIIIENTEYPGFSVLLYTFVKLSYRNNNENKIRFNFSVCITAGTHCAFLHSALSLRPAFALPRQVKAICTAGKPQHTIYICVPFKLRSVFVGYTQLSCAVCSSVIRNLAAQCVRRLYATQLSDSHLQSEQM